MKSAVECVQPAEHDEGQSVIYQTRTVSHWRGRVGWAELVAIGKVASHLAVGCTRIDGVPTQVKGWPLSLFLLNNSPPFWFLSFLTYKWTPVRGGEAYYGGCGVGCNNMFVRPLCLVEMTWTICARCGRSLSRKTRRFLFVRQAKRGLSFFFVVGNNFLFFLLGVIIDADRSRDSKTDLTWRSTCRQSTGKRPNKNGLVDGTSSGSHAFQWDGTVHSLPNLWWLRCFQIAAKSLVWLTQINCYN